MSESELEFLRVWALAGETGVWRRWTLESSSRETAALIPVGDRALFCAWLGGARRCVDAGLGSRHELVAYDASAEPPRFVFVDDPDAREATVLALGDRVVRYDRVPIAWDGDRLFGTDYCAVRVVRDPAASGTGATLDGARPPAWVDQFDWSQTLHATDVVTDASCHRPRTSSLALLRVGTSVCARDRGSPWACGDASMVYGQLADDDALSNCENFDAATLADPWRSGELVGVTFTACYGGGAYQNELSALIVLQQAGHRLDYRGAMPAGARALSNSAWLDRERPIYFSMGYAFRVTTSVHGCFDLGRARRWNEGNGGSGSDAIAAPARLERGLSPAQAFIAMLGDERFGGSEHAPADVFAHVDVSGSWAFDPATGFARVPSCSGEAPQAP
jgi:hypothetical protein